MTRSSWPKLALIALAAITLLLGERLRENLRTASQISELITQTEDSASALERRIAQSNTTAGAPQIDPTLIWKSTKDTADAERLFQTVQLERIQHSGLTLSRYNQLQPPSEIGPGGTAMQVEFAGPLSGLVMVLEAQRTSFPPTAVSYLRVQSLSESEQLDGKTIIFAQMNIWGLREDPHE